MQIECEHPAVISLCKWYGGADMATDKYPTYVRMVPELHVKLKKWAEREGRTLNCLMVYLLTKEADKFEKENGPLK